MEKGTVSFPVATPPWGWPAFLTIVLARASQPGSLPMEEWSFLSWLLMSLPVTLPYLGFAFAFLVWRPFVDLVLWIAGRISGGGRA